MTWIVDQCYRIWKSIWKQKIPRAAIGGRELQEHQRRTTCHWCLMTGLQFLDGEACPHHHLWIQIPGRELS